MNLTNMTEMIPRNMDQLLAELGLEKRRTAGHYLVPAIGVFAAGALVGGLLGLLLAPSSGRVLRGEIEKKLRSGDGDSSRENGRSTNA